MRALFLLLALLLSACGFQLRGSYSLPWETLYIALPEFDGLRAEIKRNVEAATRTKIVNERKQAQATLVILRNDSLRNILSLNAKGYVREVQLTRIFAYKIQDAAGREIAAPGQIILQREMTYDDEQILAKGAEEGLIQREMQSDLIQQLLRRLAAAKPLPMPPATAGG
ncbi:MAG: LPS assembly lipoprotein LptE [Rhodocyclaceae bacterium]|nr:LPS assembly lipoprotein LptE [Rhodocyclaceae bacterium]